jgi:hypothetical protein
MRLGAPLLSLDRGANFGAEGVKGEGFRQHTYARLRKSARNLWLAQDTRLIFDPELSREIINFARAVLCCADLNAVFPLGFFWEYFERPHQVFDPALSDHFVGLGHVPSM